MNKREVRRVSPVPVVESEETVATEFFGRVANNQEDLSVCIAVVWEKSEGGYSTPEFDQHIVILEGSVELHTAQGTVVVPAGGSAFSPRGVRLKWVFPGPSRYLVVCTPAFTPDACNLEYDGERGDSAESLARLRDLHISARHKCMFHVAPRQVWEAAKASGIVYLPATFEQDGFTHATADPALLLQVLNHFYKDAKGDFVCLCFTAEALRKHGIHTTFEAPAAVGDIAPIGSHKHELFPHLLGGIPTSGVVDAELPVVRSEDGSFLEILGVGDFGALESDTGHPIPEQSETGFTRGLGSGLVIGALAGALVAMMLSRR